MIDWNLALALGGLLLAVGSVIRMELRMRGFDHVERDQQRNDERQERVDATQDAAQERLEAWEHDLETREKLLSQPLSPETIELMRQRFAAEAPAAPEMAKCRARIDKLSKPIPAELAEKLVTESEAREFAAQALEAIDDAEKKNKAVH